MTDEMKQFVSTGSDIADALQECDWSGLSISMKVILGAAIIRLRYAERSVDKEALRSFLISAVPTRNEGAMILASTDAVVSSVVDFIRGKQPNTNKKKCDAPLTQVMRNELRGLRTLIDEQEQYLYSVLDDEAGMTRGDIAQSMNLMLQFIDTMEQLLA